MEPFVDSGIGLIENNYKPQNSTPSVSTLEIDQYRQGIEVTSINHYLRSIIPYIGSKGINTAIFGKPINHELEILNFGQGVNLDGFSSFEDRTERKDAATVLIENLIQDDQDPFFGRASQDGEIDVFSDTGKRSLLPGLAVISSKGIKGQVQQSVSVFNFRDSSSIAFFDAVDSFLGIPVQGFKGLNISYKPFNDKQYTNKFSTKIDYTYIGPDEKISNTGFDYYNSVAGTDSIAFGGWQR